MQQPMPTSSLAECSRALQEYYSAAPTANLRQIAFSKWMLLPPVPDKCGPSVLQAFPIGPTIQCAVTGLDSKITLHSPVMSPEKPDCGTQSKPYEAGDLQEKSRQKNKEAI